MGAAGPFDAVDEARPRMAGTVSSSGEVAVAPPQTTPAPLHIDAGVIQSLTLGPGVCAVRLSTLVPASTTRTGSVSGPDSRCP